ncbi:MAG: hypothetical protein ACXW1T_04700 [Methylophilus sp.]
MFFTKPLLFITTILIATTAQSATTALSTIDARFETTQCANPCDSKNQRTWWLLRSDDQVELRDVNQASNQLTSRSEIWKRLPDGKLNYFFLMHDEKLGIEYLPDDLKLLGVASDEKKWEISSQLITESELAAMVKKPTAESYQGYVTELYTGKIQNAEVIVTWLPELRIPLNVTYTYPNKQISIDLKQLNTKVDSHLRTTGQLLDQYQRVYFTDIGDMEQNADAQQWIAKANGAPGLHSHQH